MAKNYRDAFVGYRRKAYKQRVSTRSCIIVTSYVHALKCSLSSVNIYMCSSIIKLYMSNPRLPPLLLLHRRQHPEARNSPFLPHSVVDPFLTFPRTVPSV